mmetsp:Transcript_16752/g.47923  ORF Transcript_16752/g.47923 Transcript_16752/m.47923 type:complete len:178 (+) Transcript_16752:59-592(+)
MEVDTMASASSKNAVDAKILSDLKMLNEKMDLCHSMLNPGAADPKLSMQSEAMLAVIGFLEACAPRMVELVEAAATGILSEEVFAECLSSNDRLQKLLADVDTAAMTETTASTTAASAPAVGDVTDQVEDLLLGEPVPAPAGGKTTGEEEDSKQPASGAPPPGDEFDDFFAERTSQS